MATSATPAAFLRLLPLLLLLLAVAQESVASPAEHLPMSNCRQSCTGWGDNCRKAIDGNWSTQWSSRVCSDTRREERPWWQASTSQMARITRVTLYNRGDCCSERLSNFVIKVDNVVCARYQSSRRFSSKTFACNRTGRTVRVESRKRTYLTLCEVQVYGHIISQSAAVAGSGRGGKKPEVSATKEYRHLGCFRDAKARDLSVLKGKRRDMTRELCGDMCRKAKFPYFGVQYHSECFCGNSYGRYGKAASSQCSARCSGDVTETCGGAWRNDVFVTGVKKA